MKRRGFLQALGGAVAAVFVPAVAIGGSEPKSPSGFRPVAKPISYYEHQMAAGGPIFMGDIVILDGGSYRRARHTDMNREAEMAVAVPDGHGGFYYMRDGVYEVRVAA